MELGKKLRKRRLFKEGRAVVVPIDHPLYFGPIAGLEDPVQLVHKLARAGADAILVSLGTLEIVADALQDMSVVLRLDGTHSKLGKHLERIELISSVEEAAKAGVEAVVVNVFVGTDNEDVLLTKLGKVARDCREFGMLLIGEMIPAPILETHYGKNSRSLSEEERAEYSALACRVGAEIGVDVVKTHYSGSKESFRRVTGSATRPVLVAGGIKRGKDIELFQGIRDAMDSGAAGACIGRNVWQRDDVERIISVIRQIVHNGASPEEVIGTV